MKRPCDRRKDAYDLIRQVPASEPESYLLFCTPDCVVAHISKRVAVMYLGQFVELAPTEKLFSTPRHPYTEALMSAIPEVNPNLELAPVHLKGEIPSPVNPPSGCRFHTRCPYVQEMCKTDVPVWQEIEPERFVSRHFADSLQLKGAVAADSIGVAN